MDWILSQARVYNNLPLLEPKYRSVVHLEDEEDKAFWDEQLQKYRPGNYFYVPYSKSNKGKDTSGCEQCLKYKPYLSSRFFICIDSDLRYLLGEVDLDANHHVIQTYTYSWENHYCEAGALQTAVAANASGLGFDFSIFLPNLSAVLYEPLLLLLYCKRTGNSYLDEQAFRHILKTQCTTMELQNNGQGYVECIKNKFGPYLVSADTVGFDLTSESALYAARGLNASNAYLHVRGHNIYDLILYIGRIYCRTLQKSFGSEVLDKVVVGGSYWEYSEIANDLRMI